MTGGLEIALVGGLIRVGEALLAAGPTLLVGMLIAAVLRYYLGEEGTRRLFGGDSLRALPQSWLVGMLLPVCSIGVLPILFEMRRCKVKPGAMSAFAISAPLFNPLSLLYGLTLSRPYVILMFALGSLLVVTVVGMIWDSFQRRRDETKQDEVQASEAAPVIGIQRLKAMIVMTCRGLCGPAGGWACVAASGMLLIAAIFPYGSMQHSVNRDDLWAPARMAAVAAPLYATPMMAMSQLGMMFQHANSPGAAFILLVLGTGANLATVAWLARHFGVRSVAVWFSSLMIVVVSIAYLINRPLIPPGVEPATHTHAFDIYTNPIAVSAPEPIATALGKAKDNIGIAERVTLGVVTVLLGLGLLFRLLGIEETSSRARSGYQPSSDWQAGQEQREGAGATVMPMAPALAGFDRIVSPQVVGGTLLAGLVALSVVMCYGYYPSPDECLEEIRFIRADTLSSALSGDAEHAMFWIPRWDEWSRRLEVGTFLRRGQVTPYQRMQGYLIRKKLELLEHELAEDDHDPEGTRALISDILATNSRWVRAFREPPDARQAAGHSVVAAHR